MSGRTLVVGDIHGALDQWLTLLGRIPRLDADDTIVFLGDYVDRGPDSAGVIHYLREDLPRLPCHKVLLRGNHEAAWLKTVSSPDGYPEFVMPVGNGCRECLTSFRGPAPEQAGPELKSWFDALLRGTFWPPDVVEWMRALPFWYEDEHAIYVHGGLPRKDGRWLHPADVSPPDQLLWLRDLPFFLEYDGKRVICGHTTTASLPAAESTYTPDDPRDLWAHDRVLAIDTGAGKPKGFLTAVMLPDMLVYESR